MSDFPRGQLKSKNSQSLIKKFGRFSSYSGRYPFVVKRATGGYIKDVDENKFVDFDLISGSLLLGHRPPQISKFVKNVISTVSESVYLNKWHILLVEELVRRFGFRYVSLFQSFDSALNSLGGSKVYFTDNTGWVNNVENISDGDVLVARYGFLRHADLFVSLLGKFKRKIEAVVLGEELSAGFPIGVVLSDRVRFDMTECFPFSAVAGFKNLFLVDRKFDRDLMRRKAEWIRGMIGGESVGSSLRVWDFDVSEAMKWGIFSLDGVFHISPVHSQNDLTRLVKFVKKFRR